MLSVKNLSQKLALSVIICMSFVLLINLSAFATDQPQQPAGEIIVRYRSGVSPGQMIIFGLSHGTANLKTVGDIKIQEVEITDGSSVNEKLNELKKDPSIEYAEPNYKRQAQITTPNDTYYSGYQWNMPIIRANYVWDITRGSNSTVIAIIDTGVSLTHPDLSSKIIAGYDFVDNDSNPMDEQGHGTHVAGIAAAITNNGVGVAGVNWNARIMPVRVLDENGSGWDSDIAEGIIWAADNGADVINMSLGGPTSYPYTLQSAVDYAYSHGVVVVAAVGNSPNGIPIYPASCSHVIGVGATNSSDQRASFSNYGTFVDVTAPGETIASTYWSGGANVYAQASGTSMATPHVAGLAALLAGQYPTFTPAQIEGAIENTAFDLGASGYDIYYGYGRIDAYKAITQLDHFAVSTPTTQTAGAPFAITVTAKDKDNNTLTIFSERVGISDSTGTITLSQSGSFVNGVWTGNVTVTKAGSTAISVTYGTPAVSGTSGAFTVNPGPLNHVTVSPDSVLLVATMTQVFVAQGYDQFSNAISGLTYNWAATGGAPISGVGGSFAYTAGSTAGDYLISATANSVTGSTVVQLRTHGEHPNGTLVSYAGKVYLLEEGKKRWVTTLAAFNSYRFRWDRVEIISQTEFESYPEGAALRICPGTLIMGSDTNVYITDYVGGEYRKRWVNSLAAFYRFGFHWEDLVIVPDSEIGLYNVGTPLGETDLVYPNGCLISYAGKVCFIEEGSKRWVYSLAAFYSYNLRWDRVEIVSKTEFDGIPDVEPPLRTRPGTLIASSNGTVYVTDYVAGVYQKRHITSPAIFSTMGLHWTDIYAVSDSELNTYTTDPLP